MATRYPPAKWDGIPGAGSFKDGPYRGVLHTTEGSTYAGARAAYLTSRVSPHFTIGVEGCWQHVDIDRAASALLNSIGGVETNRLSTIQVEVIGFASKPAWPDQLLAAVRDLMIWVEAQTGIRPWAPPAWGGDDAYGLRTRYRMTPSAWLNFDGWCGHQHVPENEHWDPGRIPIDRLLERSTTVAEIRLNHPPKLILVRPQGDGYWIVAYDGGVFAFGAAPALAAIGGDPVERITAGDVWPDGNGLLLMGEDGGVFALGSADFIDRVYFG